MSYNREWYARNAERLRPIKRARKKGTVVLTSQEVRRAWEKRNPQKRRAYNIIQNEIRRGRLVRPDTCEDCGNRPGLNRAGTSLIHAHHDDYNEPLSIRWLCVDCHKAMERIEVSRVLS